MLSRVKIFRLRLNLPQNTISKICQKNVFYALLVVLPGRFVDSHRRTGDSVCIRETPRKSGRVGIIRWHK